MSSPDRRSDRRKDQRFDAVLDVKIRFLPGATPVDGAGVDVGPNGMRVVTEVPLIEASFVTISFANASNNTHCEGRVVWTSRSKDNLKYESGIDIQRWGGDTPTAEPIQHLPVKAAKRDRRKTHR
jgi:hypothetical protein